MVLFSTPDVGEAILDAPSALLLTGGPTAVPPYFILAQNCSSNSLNSSV